MSQFGAESPPISLTDTALARVEQLIIQKNNDNLKLRVYIVGGGCSGFQYGFSFDEAVNPDDFVVEKKASDKMVTVLVDALSLQYLEGAVVDFRENLQGSRFIVENPNAETTCGCGSSFSLKEDAVEAKTA